MTTAQGWFAARPCGTENVYKLYAESFRDADASRRGIVAEAQEMVGRVLERRSSGRAGASRYTINSGQPLGTHLRRAAAALAPPSPGRPR